MHFPVKGARARVYFPATYFLYSIARIARTPSLFFVNITKDKYPLTQKRSAVLREEHVCIFRFTGLSVVETAKKLEKSECWMVK